MDTVSEDEAVLAAIGAEVMSRAPSWYGTGAAVRQPAAAELRRFSFFLRFTITAPRADPARVIVKVPRRPETTSLAVAATQPGSPAAVREHAALQAIREWVGTGGDFAAVRPLGVLDPWNAFAVEELPARNLKRLAEGWRVLSGGRGAWDQLGQAYERAGRWLAGFHEALGGAVDRTPDQARLRAAAATAAAAVERSSRGRVDGSALREPLLARVEAVAAARDRVAVLHGDFMPHNILATADGRIAVIDTQRKVTGSIYEDLASLATDLRTLPLQLLTGGLAYPASRVRRCVQALLRGYFEDRPHEPPLLALHCAVAVLRKWAFYEQRIASLELPREVTRPLASWTRWLLRRRFQECLSR